MPKKWYYLGIFPKMGVGHLNSQNFCVITIALKTPLTHLKITQVIEDALKSKSKIPKRETLGPVELVL